MPFVYLGGLLFSLPAGHLADRWGVRPTLLGGLQRECERARRGA